MTPKSVTRRLRFGAVVLPNRPWDELVARWREVERLGLDTLWVADHLANELRAEGPWLEGWTTLAAMAASTERILIGTMVSSIVLRPPALLAKQAVTLDHLSGGRLELGIGAGGSALDHRLLGEEPWPPRERAERFREYVTALDRLLRGGELAPPPLQRPRPPLTIAAWSRRTLEVAAELGDAWNTMGGVALDAESGLAAVRAQSARLDEAAARAGRDPAVIRRSLLLARRWIADTPFASELAFREFVAKYREAGIDEFVFYYPPEPFLPEGSVAPGVFEKALTEIAQELRGAER